MTTHPTRRGTAKSAILRTAAATALCAFLAVAGTGCATIFNGSHDDVIFRSEPPDAEIYINGELRGKTPTVMELEADGTYDVEFRKAGYATATSSIGHSVGGTWIVFDAGYLALNMLPAFAMSAGGTASSAEGTEGGAIAVFVIVGFTPMLIDAATGDWYELKEDALFVRLAADTTAMK